MERFLPLPNEPLLRYYQLLLLCFSVISACITVIRSFTCVQNIFFHKFQIAEPTRRLAGRLRASARRKRRILPRHMVTYPHVTNICSPKRGNPKSDAFKLESD